MGLPANRDTILVEILEVRELLLKHFIGSITLP